MIAKLFSRRCFFSTLLVLGVAAVFIRLGFWQLDRLASRKASAAEISVQLNAPVLVLDSETAQMDLTQLTYRHIQVTGIYDPSGEIVLRNQVWVDSNTVRHNGVHLLTPLIIAGTQTAILVDRGWIPADEASPDLRSKYAVAGRVTVYGILRNGQKESDMGMVREATIPPGENRRDVWNFANVEAIASQLDYHLLPVYVQEEPQGEDRSLPYAIKEYPDLSEGAHLGFAFQWFSLAAIVLIGYPILLNRQQD